MVPEPEFESYYGRQIIKTPTWKTPDVPLYLFLGGLAGTSAVVDALNHIVLIAAVIAFAAGVLCLFLIRQQDFVVRES